MASFSTMRVDAPSLFSLLNHAKSNNLLPLRDSDNFVIGSQDQARHHKDSVFTSIFDLEAVFSICKQPGLAFAQNITSLPGAKSVEMLGTRLKPNKFHCHNDLSVKQGSFDKVLHDPVVIQECQNRLKSYEQRLKN
ncbi:uncharacterized protein RHIMIDRAFT_250502 [Rhizopus microsporus ATCC 52813]|uniref:Uncharacterized protein n=1 Tax=Rhizopus microsporus ATCC 52813 TaxID=1340429 RepID=A0A2G4T050_RHIZD|nr:uncharacterized protein RHIMIDRAFT_250502 [Rhizopus microsporus ATCC 52813]PHZ14402.1 hypothetical protein RHIMIDRAFT_250502 [Rhizopus microsporus ATCC 52813]